MNVEEIRAMKPATPVDFEGKDADTANHFWLDPAPMTETAVVVTEALEHRDRRAAAFMQVNIEITPELLADLRRGMEQADENNREAFGVDGLITLTADVAPDVAETIREAAADAGQTVSDYINLLISRDLKDAGFSPDAGDGG